MTQLRQHLIFGWLVCCLSLLSAANPARAQSTETGSDPKPAVVVAPAAAASSSSAPLAPVETRTIETDSKPGQAEVPATSEKVDPRPEDAPKAPEPPRPSAEPSPPNAEPSPPPLVGTEIAPPAETVVETPSLRIDLWARVRQNYALPPLDNDLVRKWEQYYATRPDYMQRMLERGGRYLFHIVEEVERRQMPAELALLPFIESAFNPHAVSSARASGIWQFMPATGRSFDLRQNVFRDDRRSVLDSTRAALDYLSQLHGMFGDWQLALAAYNWGQGNVGRALANNRRVGRAARYDDLSMPDETRNYVPKLQAIVNIVSRPQDFGLQLPPLENHPYFLTVSVDKDIDVALAARLAGLPIDEFRALNPQMNKPVILAAGTSMLLLPFDNAQRFRVEMKNHRGPFASWTAWVAPATLGPAEVAKRVGMSESELREVNRIPPRMLIKAGSTLLVPRLSGATRDVSEHVADTAAISLAPEARPARRMVVKVGPKGESVAALARRYKLPAAQVASWNDLGAKDQFKPGQQVVLFAKPAPATTATTRQAATKATAKARQPASRTATKQASSQQNKKGQANRPVVRVAAQPSTAKR